MVVVPTAEQEDARRVTRERKGLVREQTKLINRLKAVFACLGIRDFKPHLKKAPELFSVTVDGYSDIAQRHRKISDIAQRH